ncbi:hypothetical protein K1T71_000964 [Dendrolimus kikuchii]|uniref:Uncharacterized protein n=1 Tax=Dendrolimus kikuchii TaxID=765133 RepID=A0ACC1DGA0_9NEOP|nr:hypothetical protein K1T71_000964 [Dendrolimus kikuchii]
MIIENPDAFKSWLTSILEPLCDADPAALAKYVYALVKKDKPVDELREVMVDQLDVFLQQETKPFVEMLFTSLESQEYLKLEREIERQPSPTPQQLDQDKPEVIENNGPEPPTNPVGPRGSPPPGAAPRHRLVVSRGEKPPIARAPPHEQTLVKVLPLTELLEEPVDQLPRRRDRRGDSLRDKDERRRRRSRSWERRARPRRHIRDNEHNNDQRRFENSRRPPSRSPSPRGRYRNRSPPAGERQPSRSRSRSPAPLREREHERERDRMRVPREIERDRMSRDREHRERISRSRDRERSRERSRDRSRGSTSPHPETRLELNDPYKRRCRDFDEKGYCMRGDLCQWDHGADPVVLEDAALTRVFANPPLVPEYNPLTPDIWCGGGPFAAYPPPHPHPHHPHAPRELIPIPRVRHEIPPSIGASIPPPPPLSRPPPPNKKAFDFGRLGPRPPLPPLGHNCSLEVRKVPRGLNDITHLNNHFCKFGKIVNIQLCYDGDPEAALITFSNPTEANVAYKSTEAVLNNRFIKVFWHNPENKQENQAPSGQQAGKPVERNSMQHPMSHNKVLINRDNIKATADNKQQISEKEKETANGQEPKKDPVKPVEKSKLVKEQYARAEALLRTQLRQQRLLIQKLESGNVKDPQRAALIEAINSSQEGIEKLQKELVAYTGMIAQIKAKPQKPKTREEAQKEILDAELDMFTKQQEGQDVTDLAKKIKELRHQMAIHFPVHQTMRRTHSRGGRFNTATRYTRGGLSSKMFSVNQSVDHRPRALLISGFEADELDALVVHFSQFGEVTHKQVDLAVPQLVLQYKARTHAEQAAIHGKHYSDRTLQITWVANNNNNNNNTKQQVGGANANANASASTNVNPSEESSRAAPAQNGDANTVTEENKEETPHETEDALLRFDEEEEEDTEEDRSWRR